MDLRIVIASRRTIFIDIVLFEERDQQPVPTEDDEEDDEFRRRLRGE